MSVNKLDHYSETISQEEFDNCLREIELQESRNRHAEGEEQRHCSFRQICIHCPCISISPTDSDSSCEVCEKQRTNYRCHENYTKRLRVTEGEDVIQPAEVQGSGCTTCAEYVLQYDSYKSQVASARVEAEMIEAELEGIEYVKLRINRDEACSSALDETYSSILLRRIRLIQNFIQQLIISRPITTLHGMICSIHIEELPTVKILEEVTSDLLLGIWRGDINYVPHLQR